MAQKLEPAHLMQARRKWSDWSECSVNCLRTRHRLNCDDLLAAQNETVASSRLQAKQPAPIGDTKPVGGERARKGSSQEERDQDDELAKSQEVQNNNAEDDDYADEGDEADEVDSCDSVLDTSKTFEQQACSDGLCRLASLAGQVAGEPKQQVVASRPRVAGARPRRPSHRSRPAELVPAGEALDVQVPPAGLQQDTNTMEAQLKGQKQTNLVYRGALNLVGGSSGNGSSSSGEPSGTLNSSSGSIWTRNMWQKQLEGLGGHTGGQANLIIQWTILIGCLLTTVLLVALLLRKLFLSIFPSYHRMLAKQTIKSSSANQMDSVDSCCPHHGHQAALRRPVAYPPQGLDPLGPPHARHYDGSWTNTGCPSFSQATLYADASRPDSCKNFPRAAFQQFVLEPGGRHVMVADSIGPKFNTDASLSQFQVLDNNVASTTTKSTGSSSNGSAVAHCRRSRGSAKLIANCHYDTLDCNSKSAHSNHYQHCESVPVDYRQDMGFYLTQDFVPFAAEQALGQPKGLERPENADRSGNSRSLDRDRPNRRRIVSSAGKHESPNVPQAASGNDQDHDDEDKNLEVDEEDSDCNLQDRRPSDARSSGGSLSIDNSSPSVQSTTAPVLSNAGSSSFEQAPELSDYAAPLEPPATPLAASVSAGASPAAGKTPRRVTKVVQQSTAAQSQPNSPMFANQFANSRFKQRHMNNNSNNSKPSSIQRHKLSSRKQPAREARSARDSAGYSGDNCDIENVRDDERHYYEEIDRRDFT